VSKIVPISEFDELFRTFKLSERIRMRELFYDGCILNGVPRQGLRSLREVVLLRIEKIKIDHCE